VEERDTLGVVDEAHSVVGHWYGVRAKRRAKRRAKIGRLDYSERRDYRGFGGARPVDIPEARALVAQALIEDGLVRVVDKHSVLVERHRTVGVAELADG
jgi:hypothetical protein